MLRFNMGQIYIILMNRRSRDQLNCSWLMLTYSSETSLHRDLPSECRKIWPLRNNDANLLCYWYVPVGTLDNKAWLHPQMGPCEFLDAQEANVRRHFPQLRSMSQNCFSTGKMGQVRCFTGPEKECQIMRVCINLYLLF